MSDTPRTVALIQLIGAYGVQCSETKELAPTKEFSDAINEVVKIEFALAAKTAECERLRGAIAKLNPPVDLCPYD